MPSGLPPKPARGRDAARPGDFGEMLCRQQALLDWFTDLMLRRGSLRGLTWKRDPSPWRWPPIMN
jgi:hypothetical protein